MSLEKIMPTVGEWITATEALAAIGAELGAHEAGVDVHPDIAAALRGVSKAAGFPSIDELPPPQRAMVRGIIRATLHQATDLVDNPGRTPGWAYTEPAILDGWGRASMMVPSLIATAHPDLAQVTSFLDVGTGVGLLAVAATNIWPSAAVVGIDPWATSLERARANVAAAGLEDRITLRQESIVDLDDTDAFDCVWIPAFFINAAAIEQGLPNVVRALKPGGRVVLGRGRDVPDPLGRAIAAFTATRDGGANLDRDHALELLEKAGCDDVHYPQQAGPAPIDLALGRRPG
jgi:SAM-dependent methyltransferase